MLSPLKMAVFSSIGWFSVFIVGHISWMQLTRDSRYSRVIAQWFSLSMAACVATSIYLKGVIWDGPPLGWIIAVGVAPFLMCCAFILYMPFVFVVASSVSGDALVLLKRAGGCLGCTDIYRIFVSTEAARRRMENMSRNGLVFLQADRYRLHTKAVRTARFFNAIKTLWKLGAGG